LSLLLSFSFATFAFIAAFLTQQNGTYQSFTLPPVSSAAVKVAVEITSSMVTPQTELHS